MKQQKERKNITNEKEQPLTKAENCKSADKNFPVLLQTDYITANKKLVFLCLFLPIEQVILLPDLTEVL